MLMRYNAATKSDVEMFIDRLRSLLKRTWLARSVKFIFVNYLWLVYRKTSVIFSPFYSEKVLVGSISLIVDYW